MEDFETTDPVEGGALPAADTENEAGPGDPGIDPEEGRDDAALFEPSPDDEDEGDRADDDDERFEEIERDGKRAKIPAWLKPELMMQADYTRKTQELAEARRGFEGEREAARQASQAELSARGNLAMIERQLVQFGQIDFNVLNGIDPEKARQAIDHVRRLQEARQHTLGYLGEAQRTRAIAAENESAMRLDAATQELARDLPEWGPDMATTLFEFGQSHYGFSAEDLDGIDDARAVKALHAAYQWEQHQARVRQAKRHAAAQNVKPAARLGGAAPGSGLDDRLSTEEWVRRRNGKLRKRR
jgi:hypothetical protein